MSTRIDGKDMCLENKEIRICNAVDNYNHNPNNHDHHRDNLDGNHDHYVYR